MGPEKILRNLFQQNVPEMSHTHTCMSMYIHAQIYMHKYNTHKIKEHTLYPRKLTQKSFEHSGKNNKSLIKERKSVCLQTF